MAEFVREFISGRYIKEKVGGYTSQNIQTDLGIPQRRVPSVTLFLVAVNGILVNKS